MTARICLQFDWMISKCGQVQECRGARVSDVCSSDLMRYLFVLVSENTVHVPSAFWTHRPRSASSRAFIFCTSIEHLHTVGVQMYCRLWFTTKQANVLTFLELFVYNTVMGRPRKSGRLRMDTDLRIPMTTEQKAIV